MLQNWMDNCDAGNTTMRLSDIDFQIGNWASCVGIGDLQCSGWIELHTDDPYAGGNNGIWTIEVIACAKDAALVHRQNGKFVVSYLSKGDIVSFRYDRLHGLLPASVAKELDGKRYWAKCGGYVDWFKRNLPDSYYRNVSTPQNRARLIWRFL